MRILIENGRIVNAGRTFEGSVVVENDRISEIFEHTTQPRGHFDRIVDATGAFVLPGVIDTHVHFREPGLTEKADIESESRAAAYGGVTSYFEMPNTLPQTTTLEALDGKLRLAKEKSHVNYAFFFGATNDNSGEFRRLDRRRVPGIKLFMGSSTGNMLVDGEKSLEKVFETAAGLGFPVVAHCEDSTLIERNMAVFKSIYGDDPDVRFHPLIRSEEACLKSSSLAVALARKSGARLHIAHLSTARELDLLGDGVTGEACVAHLLFTQDDFSSKGTRIKCNPAIKTADDRAALRRALVDGRISTVATDHAPHLLSQKEGGCARAASGMPMVQFSLPAMLGLADEGVLSVERVVELMCHNPARLFGIGERGFLERGFKADIAIVRRVEPYAVTRDIVQSKCGWSPLEGDMLRWRVETTICNGRIILDSGEFDPTSKGEALVFTSSKTQHP
ncbi:MAG: dihydroorotase [Prevotella sp.]|nr:dihydroorotase [Prevotella sp.]